MDPWATIWCQKFQLKLNAGYTTNGRYLNKNKLI